MVVFVGGFVGTKLHLCEDVFVTVVIRFGIGIVSKDVIALAPRK